MRGLSLLTFVLAAPLLAAPFFAACATSSPIQPIQGGGGAGGAGGASTSTSPSATTGSLTGSTGSGGARSCGVESSTPDCNSCIQADCCNEAGACAADGTCLECFGPSPAPACSQDQALTQFLACLSIRCTDPCMTGGAASSSSASSSSSAAASSSSSSSSSSGGALACPSVDWGVGCCDAQGVLHFCDVSLQVVDQVCAGGDVCGWSAAEGYYDCVPPPGGVDPSGTYPIACGAP